MRLCLFNKYIAHTESLFKSLKLLKIQDIYVLTVLKFYYKHCHNQPSPSAGVYLPNLLFSSPI